MEQRDWQYRKNEKSGEKKSSERSCSAATCEAMVSEMKRTEKCFWTLCLVGLWWICGLSIAEALQFHGYGGGRSQVAVVREERFSF